ncbi:NAD(+)--arginine ADP-ribosyltransferase [Mycobacterium sp. 852002-51971_SCH5477799-a]|uniref:TNT domain-containing protein n=1 Tax=Mycobacterium sp. 852002-51971_SCH5477799-a TaxID=1834106 RepID=UPI0007FE7302|nr:TNT domain-containing protein [Mycobacterium sp. 852002-51971_SCH5477799-a]OBF67755.1 NAD(+)--arginine ADP-ribosyltransferase [Mycobacterium sp. 852002-51971_SCH5477799-a]
MAPLACDPTALDRSGATVLATGVSLGSVISALTTALAGSAGMAGDDPVGAALGRAYNEAAAKVIEAMTSTRNGLCSIGDGVRMSAHNYALAEAMSDVTGRAGGLPTPPVTAPLTAASHPPSAVGAGSSPPAGWSWVAPYIGMIWPTGDSAKLRAAAAAWTTAGVNFMTSEIAAGGATMAAIAGQQIPEAAAINKALADASGATTSVARQCQTIAAQLTSYAAKIEKVHAAILDLLSRICDPLTGIKEVWDLLTDEDEDEIKKIADDIKTVVDNFSQEAEKLGDQIKATISEAATATKDMAHWADKEWDHFLHGTPVGRALNQVGQTFKGVGVEGWDFLKGLYDISQFHALLDPKGYGETMTGMVAGAGTLVGLGPDGGPGVAESWKALGKDITHWDEWSSNPAEALGKSIFDVGTLALPGGPLSKLGKVGHTAADALKGLKKPPELKLPTVKPPAEPAAAAPKPPEAGQPAPAPAGKPGPSGKPAPGPADGPLPHSPTESKPPPLEKPPAAEPPKPAATPPEPGGKPPVPVPPGDTPLPHSKPPEPVPAHAPASAGEPPVAPAPHAGRPSVPTPAAAAHVPAAPSVPVGGGAPTEIPSGLGDAPHGGEPGAPHPPGGGDGPHQPGDGDGPHHPPDDGHPPSDGNGPHQPGDHHPPDDGDRPPGSHPPHDGARPDEPADGHPPEIPAPSDLQPWHQAQLALAESPEQLVKDLLEHGCPRELAESAAHSPYEGMSAQDILNKYWDPVKKTWHWPEHDGFADGKWETSRRIPTETRLNRIGEISDTRGEFMGAVGDSYPQRSLAPGSSGDYNIFHGTGKELPEGWEVRYGKVGEAFGWPGGGTQWVVVNAKRQFVMIDFLLKNGYLALE